MNSLFKSALRRGVIGFALGLAVSAGMPFLASPGAFAGDAGAFAARLLPGGVYGAVVMGCSVVYNVERWSIAGATLTHLPIALVGLYILGFAQSWLEWSPFGFAALTLGCVAVYILNWLVQWLSLRGTIQRINGGMKDWKATCGGRSASGID